MSGVGVGVGEGVTVGEGFGVGASNWIGDDGAVVGVADCVGCGVPVCWGLFVGFGVGVAAGGNAWFDLSADVVYRAVPTAPAMIRANATAT